MILIYTGNGKGKTSAALGSLLRMSGYLKKSCLIQFIKDGSQYGEQRAIKEFLKDYVDIYQAGIGFYKLPGDYFEESDHRRAAEEALKLAEEKMHSENYDLLILDEVLTAVSVKLLQEEDVLKLMKSLPDNLHLILTGRGATEALIDAADLVTEMLEIKHPFQKKKKAVKGIDY